MADTGVRLDTAIMEKINENSHKATEFYDFAGPFKNMKNLGTPVITKLKQLDFYNGSLAPQNDYVPDATNSVAHSEKYKKTVSLEDIFMDFKEGQLSFVGSAGSGKTTLLKRITRIVLSGKCESLKDIELVHYVDVRGIDENAELSVVDYLFRNSSEEFTPEEKESIMQFITDYPEKVLFIIDSLDTLPYSVENGESEMEISEKRKPATLMHCLLSGSVLPKCRSITSSREYAIRNFGENLRASKVIGLDGLPTESMHEIIGQYLDEDEAHSMIEFLKNNPAIESICETPLFLVFTLIVRKNKSLIKAQSIAGILVSLLRLLFFTYANREQLFLGVIDKLGNLSAKLTEERRVVFTKKDIEAFGLSIEDLKELAIVSPAGSPQKLILGEEVFFYAHLSVQEILTTFHVIKRSQEDYEDALEIKIHTPQYSVIRRLLCGTLLDKDALEEASCFFENLSAEDVKRKQLLLRWSIIGELFTKQSVDMEFALLLVESGTGLDDISLSKINTVRAGYNTLTAGRGHALGLLLRRFKTLKYLEFDTCGPHAIALENVHRQLLDKNLKIQRVVISGIPNMGAEKMSLIAKILNLCSTEELEVNNSVTVAEAVALATNLKENTTTELKNANNLAIILEERMTKEDAKGLEKFARKLTASGRLILKRRHQESTYEIANIQVVKGHKELERASGQATIRFHSQSPDCAKRVLSLLENFTLLKAIFNMDVNLQKEGDLQTVGNAIKQYQIQYITLWFSDSCRPSVQNWKDFKRALDGFKMSSFTLQEFVEMNHESMSVLGEIYQNNSEVKEIDFGRCEVTTKGLENFNNSITELKVETFKLNIINSQGCRSYLVVGQIMVQCRAKNIEIILSSKNQQGFCNEEGSAKIVATWSGKGQVVKCLSINCVTAYRKCLSPTSFAAFLQGLKSAKITEFIINENTLTARSISAIVELIPVWNLKKLVLQQCRIVGVDSKPISRTPEKTSDFKLSVFDMCLDRDSIEGIVEIVANCGTCTLELKPYTLSDEHLLDLAFFLGARAGISIQRLKLCLAAGNWNIESLPPLLRHVSNDIDLSDWDIDRGRESLLQNELNKLHPSILKIGITVEGRRKEITSTQVGIKHSDIPRTRQKQSKQRTEDDIAEHAGGPTGKRLKLDTDEGGVSRSEVLDPIVQVADDQRTTYEDDDRYARMSEEIYRRIKTKSTISKIIGPLGGSVENLGYTVTFPSKAWDNDTKVETAVITDFSNCPEGRIPIAPRIECKPSGRLNRPALLEVEHWAFPTKDDEPVFAELFRKDSGNTDWQFVEKIRIVRGEKISFRTEHFTLYELVVKIASWVWDRITRPLVEVTLQTLVYINGTDHSIACVSCLKGDKIRNDVIQGLEIAGYKRALLPPETTHAHCRGEVKIKIECNEPQNLQICDNHRGNAADREVESVFPVQTILTNGSKSRYLLIRLINRNLMQFKGMLRFTYSHTADYDNNQHAVQIGWPIPGDVPTHQTIVHNYGNIRTNAIVAPNPQDAPPQ